MAQDDDLAGTSAGDKNSRGIREFFPVTFDRRDNPRVKDFRPRPEAADSPTLPPVIMPEELIAEPIHPSLLPAAD